MSQQWVRSVEIPEAPVNSLMVTSDTLWAAMDSAAYFSVTNGSTWTRSSDLPLPLGGIRDLASFGGAIYASTYNGGVYRSTDLGATWLETNDGLTANTRRAGVFVVRHDTLFVGTEWGVYRLVGATTPAWAQEGTGLVSSISGSVDAIIVYQDALVAASGANGVVYILPTGATEWKPSYLRGTLSPGEAVKSFTLHQDTLFCSSQSGVYASGDLEHWISRRSGLPFVAWSFTTLAPSGDSLFLVTNTLTLTARTYLSTDRGESWTLWDTQSGTEILDMEIASGRAHEARALGYYYAELGATDARAVAGGVPEDFLLEQPYPNPFNPSTTILFSIPRRSAAKLAVYDGLGREVAVVVSKELDPGTYSLQWSAAGIPSGVYFLRLETPHGARTRRLLLIR